MTQPLAFSIQCYQWGANQPYLSPSSTAPQGKLDHLTESMKGVARCVYMVAVSTFIAPCGMLYHVGKAIVDFSWTPLNATATDFIALVRGCTIPVILVPFLTIGSIACFWDGIRNTLSSTLSPRKITVPIFLGTCIGAFAYRALKKDSHILKAWDNLKEVEKCLSNDSIDNLLYQSPGSYIGTAIAVGFLIA